MQETTEKSSLGQLQNLLTGYMSAEDLIPSEELQKSLHAVSQEQLYHILSEQHIERGEITVLHWAAYLGDGPFMKSVLGLVAEKQRYNLLVLLPYQPVENMHIFITLHSLLHYPAIKQKVVKNR